MHKTSKQQLFVEVPSDSDFFVYCIYYFGCRQVETFIKTKQAL